MAKIRTAPDMTIAASTLFLLAIGVIMVYSASAVLAFHDFGDSFYYLKRQLIFAVLGVLAMLTVMNIDYLILKKYAKPLLIVCFVLLVIVLSQVSGSCAAGPAVGWASVRSASSRRNL